MAATRVPSGETASMRQPIRSSSLMGLPSTATVPKLEVSGSGFSRQENSSLPVETS
jgi:hypothetical protein